MLKKVVLSCGLLVALQVGASEDLPASFVQLSSTPELANRVEGLGEDSRTALIEVCGEFDELRQLVLQKMADLVNRCTPGIEALKEVTGAEGFDLVFQLVPRFAQDASNNEGSDLIEDVDASEEENQN